MPSIKEYNRKIASLKNTVKITKTMKMVSASKLRRAQDAQRSASDYAREVNHLIYSIAGAVDQGSHPLLAASPEVKNVLLLVFTSDKGLCGGFNNNLIRFLSGWITAPEQADKSITLSFCGRRGHSYFSSRFEVGTHYEGITARPDARDATRVAHEICGDFVAGKYDEVYTVYNVFHSAMSQSPSIELLLPLSPRVFEDRDQAGTPTRDFIAEPAIEVLLDQLIPRLVNFKIFYALLENAAGEHGARMTAMDNATTNASNMIDEFTLKRNRARQAAITTELIEIISGAEAL